MIVDADLAFTLSHEVELLALVTLAEHGVIRQHQHGQNVAHELLDAGRTILEDFVLLDGLVENGATDLVTQCRIDNFQELVELKLIVQVGLRRHQEVAYLLLNGHRYLHVLHRCVRDVKFLLKLLTATIQVGSEHCQVTDDHSVIESASDEQ